MDDAAVREVARLAGVATEWIDALDHPRTVEIGSLRAILSALGYPCDTDSACADSRARLSAAAATNERSLITATVGQPIRLPGLPGEAAGEIRFENGGRADARLRSTADGAVLTTSIEEPGYHHLRVADREVMVAVAPRRCVTANDIAPGERPWGLSVQLYALRHAGDGGIGNTTALRSLLARAATQGADAIALSPTHSLFPADPARFSPYSPSSRLFFNPLLADPADVFGSVRIAGISSNAADIHALENAKLIDWPQAARHKYALLARLHDDFAANDLVQETALARDFRAFVADGGALLRQHALFEALHRRWFAADPPLWSWTEWPAEWRDPASSRVMQYAAAEPRALDYHLFLQWIAHRSFSAAQADARRGGMRIGLISDLAIGMDRGGSHAWAQQKDLLLGLNVGAPPDAFNQRGQDWGLTAFSPQALTAQGFAPFLATLRAVLRHAGGVRIDHAMGLMRLWLIPHGAAPAEGAYLSYPLDDLLRLVALESHRHRAIVIGEDLGTVPPEFRERMAAAGMAGMDVLWFQRNKTGFLPPSEWRADAIAMTSTHDLPTVAGWWKGADIETRESLGLASDAAAERAQRNSDRKVLWRAFKTAQAASGNPPAVEDTERVGDCAVQFVAKAAAALTLIPLEDMLGSTEQPNLPGTVDEHPNWRRRYDPPASELLDAPHVQRRLKALRERGR